MRSLNRTGIRLFVLFVGILFGGTAIVWIKASDENPMLVASYRLLIAAVVLTPFYLRDLRRHPGAYGWKQFSWALLPATALSFHLMTWVVGARMTQASNAVLIINLTPVAVPFFVWIFYKEKVNLKEILGTLLALSGLVWITGSTLSFSREHFLGEMICIASMLGFALYLALGRKNGGRISLWLYMIPLYYIGGVICLVSALFMINPIKTYTLNNILMILGLGIFPTVLGHTILNYSMKHFRSQFVSVANLGQILVGAFLGFLFLGDIPRPSFYGAAVVIVLGILIVLQGSRQRYENR